MFTAGRPGEPAPTSHRYVPALQKTRRRGRRGTLCIPAPSCNPTIRSRTARSAENFGRNPSSRCALSVFIRGASRARSSHPASIGDRRRKNPALTARRTTFRGKGDTTRFESLGESARIENRSCCEVDGSLHVRKCGQSKSSADVQGMDALNAQVRDVGDDGDPIWMKQGCGQPSTHEKTLDLCPCFRLEDESRTEPHHPNLRMFLFEAIEHPFDFDLLTRIERRRHSFRRPRFIHEPFFWSWRIGTDRTCHHQRVDPSLQRCVEHPASAVHVHSLELFGIPQRLQEPRKVNDGTRAAELGRKVPRRDVALHEGAARHSEGRLSSRNTNDFAHALVEGESLGDARSYISGGPSDDDLHDRVSTKTAGRNRSMNRRRTERADGDVRSWGP